jgi:hypothetical protein
MEIKILCYRTPVCYAVWRVVQQAIDHLSPQFPEVEMHITMVKDTTEIARYTHNLLLPSLVINEKLVCAGHIPCQADVISYLQLALATSGYQPASLSR